jgi:predicted ATPase
MILEDAHWIDPTSAEWFGLVIDRIQRLPVMLVITFRPEFTPPWIGHAHMTTLTLNRLGRRHGAVMIEHLTGGKPLPAEVMEKILDKIDGVPLFVEELTKTVLESGILVDAGDRYELTGPLPSFAIPATLQDSLMARLDRLAPVKEVAQIGAVIGREFGHELLAATSDRSEADLSDALDQLVSSELVFRRGTPPKTTYSFKHALVQDAAYTSLLKSKRQQLHARLAEVLEARFPETVETQPELLAQHFTGAGLFEQAAGYWRKAGERAIQSSANIEAIAHLSKGLALLDDLPESPERNKVELDLRITLGPALMAVEGFNSEEVVATYSRARDLSERAGDANRLFTALFGLWNSTNTQGAVAVGLEIADEMTRRTEASGNTGQSLQAHHCNWTSSCWAGNPRGCIDHADHGLEIYDRDVHRTHKFLYGAHDPAVCGLVLSGWAYWLVGNPDKSLGRAIEAVELAEELAHPFSSVIANNFVTKVLFFRRETEETIRYAERGLAVCEEHGFGWWNHFLDVLRYWAQAQNDGREALADMRQAIQSWEAAGTTLFMPWFLALQAIADRETGKARDGLAKLQEGLAIGERTGERWFDAELHRIRGELMLVHSARNKAKAEAAFCEALKVARAQGAKSLELRAATSLTRLWGENKRKSEARELLAPVYDWFTEGFDTPDLKDAKALLDELA